VTLLCSDELCSVVLCWVPFLIWSGDVPYFCCYIHCDSECHNGVFVHIWKLQVALEAISSICNLRTWCCNDKELASCDSDTTVQENQACDLLYIPHTLALMTWLFQETPSTECSPDSDGSLLDSTDTLEMKGKEVLQSPLYEDSEYLSSVVLHYSVEQCSEPVSVCVLNFWPNKQFDAGPSGHAVWGIGLNRLDTDTVGSNPA
jgi:hypothetical protein